jgi:uncharacterized protein (DUF433 family)
MDSAVEKSHIESRPEVCGGRPCIAGTRIRVQDIYVCHELQGMSPDQIVVAYPKLTLADVHAALAYYFDHSDQIRKDMVDESAFVAGLKAATGPGPLETLRASDGDDALSP